MGVPPRRVLTLGSRAVAAVRGVARRARADGFGRARAARGHRLEGTPTVHGQPARGGRQRITVSVRGVACCRGGLPHLYGLSAQELVPILGKPSLTRLYPRGDDAPSDAWRLFGPALPPRRRLLGRGVATTKDVAGLDSLLRRGRPRDTRHGSRATAVDVSTAAPPPPPKAPGAPWGTPSRGGRRPRAGGRRKRGQPPPG